MKKNPPSY